MTTFTGIALVAVVAGLILGLVRSAQYRKDAERRQAERTAYEARLQDENNKDRETAFMQTVERFFPFIRQAVIERMNSAASPREALNEALAAVPGVSIGMIEGNLVAQVPDELRTRAVLIWGRSGGGKTSAMTHLILDDFLKGRATIIECPEREMFPPLLALAEERAHDVIYFAPGDPACPVSFQPMFLEPGDDQDRHADEISSTIKRCLGEESIGRRSDPMLANSVALVTGREGATFGSLRRVLTDREYRQTLLGETSNEYVKQYFSEVYERLGNEAALPLLSRLDPFLRSGCCQRALGNPIGSFTIRQVLEQKKILLIDLSGLAPDTMQLIGGLITCKLLLEVLRWETALTAEERAVRIYLDEFPSICGFSPAVWETFLSRARKYHAAITLSGQVPSSLPLPIRQQLGNASTLISFSLSPRDAAVVRGDILVPGTDGSIRPISPQCLVSLAIGEGYVRLGSQACGVKVKFKLPIEKPDARIADRVQKVSWKTYATPPIPIRMSKPFTSSYSRDCTPRELPGRGSLQHKFCQDFARRTGEERGFRATLEETILGGGGRVDVSLVRGDVRVAVEVAITSTPQQIATSVCKYLAAGFSHVVVLSPDVASLRDAELQVADAVNAGDEAKINLFTPDKFAAFLDQLPRDENHSPSVAGYGVTVIRRKAVDGPHQGLRRNLARLLGTALLRRRWPS